MFLSSLSLSNTFETISEGYNGNRYMMSSLPNPAPGVTSYTNQLYMIYQRDRVLPPVTQATSQLYFISIQDELSLQRRLEQSACGTGKLWEIRKLNIA